MGLRQFANSVSRILNNRHINRRTGIVRHLQWQGRKLFDLFPVEQHISQSRIVASHRRCGVSALINSQGMYDYNNMSLLRLLLRDGGTFVDIGANIGSYTLVSSESDAVQVHAFEPHPATFQLLRRNVELNHRRNVMLHNVALGPSEGTVLLTDQGGSAVNHIVPGNRDPEGAVAVPCRRLEHICRQFGIAPTIVKIDVEGFEFGVLQGAGEFLATIHVLLIEMNGLSDARSQGQNEIHALLESAGLRGPWMCEFDRRQLRINRGGNSEDSLYVSQRFYEQDGPSQGFVFERVPVS